ncbi:hypothetical protein Pcac1_g20652 [Phytophthora cactorum]|nr:hypothetical protein Pcac1_g20652 [Phytophthora cactorum]
MRVYLQEACLANLSHRLSLIRERVMASLREAHPDDALNTIPRLPSTSHTRERKPQAATHSESLRAFPPGTLRKMTADPFFNSMWSTLLGVNVRFGHPDLVRLLRYSSSAIFIDGTFKMAPRPFTQCLIVMVKDQGQRTITRRGSSISKAARGAVQL